MSYIELFYLHKIISTDKFMETVGYLLPGAWGTEK